LIENEIRVAAADGKMATFTARPDGPGPFPVAVLSMDGVGYREQAKENASRFAPAW
jgi:dienelactone hydrolase